MRAIRSILAGISCVLVASGALAAAAPSPEARFGFPPGADGMLLDYEQIVAYLKLLDESSPRIEMRQIGTSPLGKPMYVVFVSTPENIARLDELHAINRRLALDPELPDTERAGLVARGRVFVLETLSMHANELAPCQAFPQHAWELATTEDPAVLAQLANVVLMVVPAHNPDGLDMVVENYRTYKGTPWDGADLPAVYHRYVGHDNNRDFVTLTQEDNRAIARLTSTEWFPQVMVEKHGMGGAGPRFYCPPSHDPIAENIEAGVWTWIATFGAAMARDMHEDGLTGIAQHWAFDDYWPGSTETCIWKNVVGLLTENATVRGASPIFVEPTELDARGKGLAEYAKSVNFLAPWPGGWWRLGDAVRYELSSFKSLLRTAAAHREELLRFRNDICRRDVERGRTQAPYYFVLPPTQCDRGEWVRLVNLLLEHGVQVFTVPERITAGGRHFEAGSVVVPLAQPFRPFVKEVLEPQRFPLRHFTPDGEPIRPYDITSWSLPLHRGVTAEQVDVRVPELEKALRRVEGPFALPAGPRELPAGRCCVAFSVNENEAFRAAFAALRAGLPTGRIERALAVGDTLLPAGSFVIRPGPDPAALPRLLADIGIPAVALDAEPAGLRPLKLPRIALVETHFHDMDAGWTRYLLDTYGVPFEIVRPGDFETVDFARRFDLVIFPSADKEVLAKGRYKRDGDYYLPRLPLAFRKGIGDKGMERLMAFFDGGGVILAWGRSCGLFLDVLEIKRGKGVTEDFRLPVADVGEELAGKGLDVTGSWLRVNVLQDHPLTWGMPPESGVFSRGNPVLRTSLPGPDTDRRVLASFPERDILLSGHLEGEKLLANTVAAVWTRKGKGQLVLYAFAPQFRASTPATYKLLFNALLLPRLY
ncbi:MAG TPA: M14 family zinc carboxypeptidase [Thermoanaerobaculaceae bacterium]|nr:M14 family zinc carboxypeptidase [Thermoanaerobaculaceae bacterium]HRS15116.1 M14 family zinc carboxypeptidase [Thermoanaerobaculaceae bacterium]